MLRWSLMLFVLSLVEEFFGRNNAAEGTPAVALISFVLAVCLLVLFHYLHERPEVPMPKASPAFKPLDANQKAA